MNIQLPIFIDDVVVGETRRELDRSAVNRLAESIEQIGLQHPITVREKGDKYHLIAGRHRLEACKKLGREHVPAIIVKMTNDEARLWEIAENLHRADLKKLERDEQVAEWIKITDKLHASQTATHRQAGQQPGGINAAARELGIDKDDAHRAVKVAGLSDEAKDAAREAGLDDNRSALLSASREQTPEAQVAKIINYEPRKDKDELAAVKAAYIKLSPDQQQAFRDWIDKPVMDQRFG